MLFGAVLLAIAALGTEDVGAITWTWRSLLATAWLAVFGTAVTFGVYFWLLQRVPASHLSLISYVTPPLAVILGVLVGDGAFGLASLLGTLLVVAGIALVVRGPRP